MTTAIRRPLFAALLLPLAGGLFAEEPLALHRGEQFTYRLSWGIFGKAAELVVTADEVSEAVEHQTRITMLTSTKGFIRAIYPFDGEAESVYDNSTGRLLHSRASTSSRSKETRATIELDYEQAVATYTDHLEPDRSLDVPMPALTPADFITTMIQTRHWDIDVGEERAVSVLFDDEFYELMIRADHVEKIKSPWGRTEALVLIPRMDENPKGMFKRGGEVRVWVSRGEPQLPLRFEVKIAVGTALAVLTDYTAQADTAAAVSPRPQD